MKSNESMPRQLTVQDEMEIDTFAMLLEITRGPDDLFPPDDSPTREPLPAPRPNFPNLQVALGEAALLLAA
jgi:hypothetical protein